MFGGCIPAFKKHKLSFLLRLSIKAAYKPTTQSRPTPRVRGASGCQPSDNFDMFSPPIVYATRPVSIWRSLSFLHRFPSAAGPLISLIRTNRKATSPHSSQPQGRYIYVSSLLNYAAKHSVVAKGRRPSFPVGLRHRALSGQGVVNPYADALSRASGPSQNVFNV
jgi:hypothetical protein